MTRTVMDLSGVGLLVWLPAIYHAEGGNGTF
jgi:hypothetical protein